MVARRIPAAREAAQITRRSETKVKSVFLEMSDYGAWACRRHPQLFPLE
jgi:hypothetical protein